MVRSGSSAQGRIATEPYPWYRLYLCGATTGELGPKGLDSTSSRKPPSRSLLKQFKTAPELGHGNGPVNHTTYRGE